MSHCNFFLTLRFILRAGLNPLEGQFRPAGRTFDTLGLEYCLVWSGFYYVKYSRQKENHVEIGRTCQPAD